MFRLVSHVSAQLTASTEWSAASVRQAVHELGWSGDLRGPVSFAGTSFVAVLGSSELDAPGGRWLIGCLFPTDQPLSAIRDASLLAGYSPRAILTRADDDVLEIKLQTALLDQGAVIEERGQLTVLSAPGPVVQSPLQEADAWRTDPRWHEMYQAATGAPTLGHLSAQLDTHAGDGSS